MPAITVYTTAMCPYCSRAKALLEKKGASFEEIRAGFNTDLKAQMIERSGGARTFPQIFIGETHVGGCDELFALDAEGRLDPLLSAEGA